MATASNALWKLNAPRIQGWINSSGLNIWTLTAFAAAADKHINHYKTYDTQPVRNINKPCSYVCSCCNFHLLQLWLLLTKTHHVGNAIQTSPLVGITRARERGAQMFAVSGIDLLLSEDSHVSRQHKAFPRKPTCPCASTWQRTEVRARSRRCGTRRATTLGISVQIGSVNRGAHDLSTFDESAQRFELQHKSNDICG